jgi:hypothetical protein
MGLALAIVAYFVTRYAIEFGRKHIHLPSRHTRHE